MLRGAGQQEADRPDRSSSVGAPGEQRRARALVAGPFSSPHRARPRQSVAVGPGGGHDHPGRRARRVAGSICPAARKQSRQSQLKSVARVRRPIGTDDERAGSEARVVKLASGPAAPGIRASIDEGAGLTRATSTLDDVDACGGLPVGNCDPTLRLRRSDSERGNDGDQRDQGGGTPQITGGAPSGAGVASAGGRRCRWRFRGASRERQQPR